MHLSVAKFFAHALPKDALALHVPNEGRRTNKEGVLLKAMGLLPGASDWLVIHAGKSVWIELKTGRNKLTTEQAAFMERAKRAGCKTFIARSLAEVELALDQAGIPLRGSSLPQYTTEAS